MSEFAGTGLIVAFLFAGIIRLADGRHAATLTTRFDRLRDSAIVWSLAFAALVFFFFAMKAGEQFLPRRDPDFLPGGSDRDGRLAGIFSAHPDADRAQHGLREARVHCYRR